ncbi:ATP-dependent DNA helicase PIF1-like protein, partial [Tanacetum coccineum]
VYTIEFQKRGLPHTHVCLFLHKDDKVPNADQIDKYISAEIPDKDDDPDLYKLVSDFMMHGPCGVDEPNQACMADGPDRVSAQLYEPVTTEDGQQVQKPVDEIKAFFDCRYLSACEAAWRIFGFETHYRTPYVEVSPTREQQVVYYENYDLETVIHKPSVCQSMFEGWMKMNELYPAARELTYVEFPTKYVWNAPKRIWTLRKQGKSVGRIHGKLANAAGLLEDDKEYVESIKDAAHWAPPEQLRELFVTLLSQKELTTPLTVWLQTWHLLAQCLIRILDVTEFGNWLIYDETDYNPLELQSEYERLYASLTTEQKGVYDTIMNSVETGTGGLYFVYGYGGTGKTFLWKTLVARIRRQGDIVLNVASSGIASLLMSGGQTAHSRFHIPINVDETSHCSISAQSDLGALLKRCKLIIWDEAPMANKLCFEALDRSLRNILRQNRYDTCEEPFGNMMMVFGGDFRQVLPVVPKGSRQDIVSASLKESYLWDHCNVLKLTANMRLTVGARPEDVSEIQEFIIYIKYIIDVLFVS